eukprot:294205-Rhodomonas_salina.1
MQSGTPAQRRTNALTATTSIIIILQHHKAAVQHNCTADFRLTSTEWSFPGFSFIDVANYATSNSMQLFNSAWMCTRSGIHFVRWVCRLESNAALGSCTVWTLGVFCLTVTSLNLRLKMKAM